MGIKKELEDCFRENMGRKQKEKTRVWWSCALLPYHFKEVEDLKLQGKTNSSFMDRQCLMTHWGEFITFFIFFSHFSLVVLSSLDTDYVPFILVQTKTNSYKLNFLRFWLEVQSLKDQRIGMSSVIRQKENQTSRIVSKMPARQNESLWTWLAVFLRRITRLVSDNLACQNFNTLEISIMLRIWNEFNDSFALKFIIVFYFFGIFSLIWTSHLQEVSIKNIKNSTLANYL